jgi:predicted Zn-dependent protease
LTLAGFSLPAQQPPGPAGDTNLYSVEKEAALGRQLAARFRERTTPVDSPAVQSYIDRLGQRIAAQVPDARFAFRFSVIADDHCPAIHEPVALPGGSVFVPAALVIAAQDEAELAGMLAHAIHHIHQRHAATTVNQAGVPLIYVGSWAGTCAELLMPRGLLPRRRSYELEADALGVQTMARAGYDPMALVRYIERVHLQPGPATRSSALPDREERLAALRSVIETLRPAGYAAPTGELAAVQEELRRLMERPASSEARPTLKRSGSK